MLYYEFHDQDDPNGKSRPERAASTLVDDVVARGITVGAGRGPAVPPDRSGRNFCRLPIWWLAPRT